MASRRRAAGLLAPLLSLLLVGVAVAAVAVLVVRVPLGEVDSAEHVEAVEAVIVAPPAPPSLPTRVPGTAGEPSVVPVRREPRTIAALPTVAAPQDPPAPATGPTPTPRVIAQAPAAPPALPTAVPTLPPAVAMSAVPVAALTPPDAPPTAPPAVPVPSTAGQVTQPVSAPAVSQPTADAPDAPLAVFADREERRTIAAPDDARERVQAMQDAGAQPRRTRRTGRSLGPAIAAPVAESAAVPGVATAPIVPGDVPDPDGSGSAGGEVPTTVDVPDADAMIAEITARVQDPDD